jgi:hypothetical protein
MDVRCVAQPRDFWTQGPLPGSRVCQTRHPLGAHGGAGERSPDLALRNYTLTAASHCSKLGPASFAPGLGSAAPSA